MSNDDSRPMPVKWMLFVIDAMVRQAIYLMQYNVDGRGKMKRLKSQISDRLSLYPRSGRFWKRLSRSNRLVHKLVIPGQATIAYRIDDKHHCVVVLSIAFKGQLLRLPK